MKMVDTYPDAVFLDIGSNIGMYTVMIAAMDRKVFAVDPMIFNLQLIHESLKKSGKTKYVNLINSPIRYTPKKYPHLRDFSKVKAEFETHLLPCIAEL